MSLIIDPYRFYVTPVVTDNEWSSIVKNARALLSNSNLRLQDSAGPGTYATARATKALDDMCYFSATPNAPAGGEICAFGAADDTAAFTGNNTWAGDSNLSGACWPWAGTVYLNGASVGSAGASTSSDIQVAARTLARRFWLRRAGGSWVGGGDPVTDTSPTFILSGSGLIYPMASITAGSAATITIHKDAATTTGLVPAGFTAANWL